jgi:predicted NUDIX family phosphoesterase
MDPQDTDSHKPLTTQGTALSDRESKIRDLEELASAVLTLKSKSIPRRPIVIEFCGSPKAGKTSCINSLDLFFRRNGFRTRVLSERASVCPVDNKYDPYFNIWTVSSAIAELSEVLANHSKDIDVIILDRGIFDALCWFNWLRTKKRLSDDFSPLENFLCMRRWRSVLDLVYVFIATPEVSLNREFATLLTNKTGSIMQQPILAGFQVSIEECINRYSPLFKKIERFDTTDIQLNDVTYTVTKRTLDILKDNISERIGYIKRDTVTISDVCVSSKSVPSLLSSLEFNYRSDVENDDTLLQPVPIVVVTNRQRSKILAVEKKPKSQTSHPSPETNKLLLYLGGHIREEDTLESDNKSVLEVSRFALHREVKEEIGIDFYPDHGSELFCIWDKTTTRSAKHIAVCYVLEEDLDTLKIKLDKNEFKQHVILDVDRIQDHIASEKKKRKAKLDIESWSQLILHKLFNMTSQGILSLESEPKVPA